MPHKAEESACYPLINEYLDQNKFLMFECSRCEKDFLQLAEFERHCYESEDHESATTSEINRKYLRGLNAAKTELQKLIDNAIKAKANAEYRRLAEEKRAAQANLKSQLPFAKS